MDDFAAWACWALNSHSRLCRADGAGGEGARHCSGKLLEGEARVDSADLPTSSDWMEAVARVVHRLSRWLGSCGVVAEEAIEHIGHNTLEVKT